MTEDLRTAPAADLAQLDFRAPGRDPWADEAAIWERLQATLDAVPADAWDRPISASASGGPPWTPGDHAAHLADWADEAIGCVGRVLDGDPWPSDEDYGGGDFDAFNESRRSAWAGDDREEIRDHLAASRGRLIALARTLPPDVLRSDDGWEWVFMTLHGHAVDHLAVLEAAARGIPTA